MPTIENCCLYLTNPVDPRIVFNGGEIVPAGQNQSKYEYSTAEGVVGLNMSLTQHFPEKLQGIKGWVSQLPDSDDDKQKAYQLIDSIQMVLGVILERPITEQTSAFDSLMHLVQSYGGFLFVHDSILTVDGYLVGPAAYAERYASLMEQSGNQPADTSELIVEAIQREQVTQPAQPQVVPSQPTVSPTPVSPTPVSPTPVNQAPTQEVPQHILERQAKDLIYRDVPGPYRKMREHNLLLLNERGFKSAITLPVKTKAALRPVSDISQRLMALYLLFQWVSDQGQSTSREELNDFLKLNQLARWFTPDEMGILQLNREEANAEYRNWIGWKLENIWTLAWVCGFKPEPKFYEGQVNKTILQLLVEFLPPLRGEIKGFIKFARYQNPIDVFVKEDLFYCAHNAVRSAQIGNLESVPSGYDPLADGGTVAERRHALSWCLSPGVSWDDTDLST